MALEHFRLGHDSNIFSPEDEKDAIDAAHTDINYEALLINSPEKKVKDRAQEKLSDEVSEMEGKPKRIGMRNHLSNWPDDTKSKKRHEGKGEIANKNAIRKAKQLSDKAA